MKGLAEAAADGDAFPDFLWAARSGADPRGVYGNARALVDLAEDFQDRFLALSFERHFVNGEKGFPSDTGKLTPDLPDPNLLRANGVGIHVVPGVGHAMMIDDPVATASVLGGIL